MADDIVTRLRTVVAVPHGVDIWTTTALEAADLIETQQAEIERLQTEIERLRAAIDSLLHDIDGDHTKASDIPTWCRTCGPTDGSWPCVHRMVLDELKEARRG